MIRRQEVWMDVKSLHRCGASIREIARRTGFSRVTVRKILSVPVPKPYGPRTVRPGKLDRFVPRLEELLALRPQSRVTVLYELIRRAGFPERFPSGSSRSSIAADCRLLDAVDALVADLERELVRTVTADDLAAFRHLRSVPGIGDILGLTLFYEVPDFDRFDTVQQFASYARLVAPRTESSGKLGGSRGRKQGNVHLKWAFSEAAVFLLRNNPRAQKMHSRLVARFGKAKALSVLAHKIGRTVSHMQKRKQPFDADRFYRKA